MNFELAFEIAFISHVSQQDKGGNPYILHPMAVADMMDTEDEKIVAMMHDVLEDDKDIDLDYLRKKGFSEEILEALDAITRRDGESYNAFIKRIKENPLATRVKLKDLKHNMDLSRIPKPTKEDLKRIQKYRDAEFFLQN